MPSIIWTRLTTIFPSSSTVDGLGPGDHVVGPGDVLRRHDAVDAVHLHRHLSRLADLCLDEDVRADRHRASLLGGPIVATLRSAQDRRDEKEIPGPVVNKGSVDAHDRLVQRVGQEQDDILGTLQLVRGDDLLETRLFEQLVDLLVEGLFLDLRQRYLEGAVERDEYVEELAGLADLCRDAGLLPLPSRDG